jgi:RNA polymerase sigma-70 factor, ECF subfamily
MSPGTEPTASAEPNAREPWASDPASPRPTFDQIYAEGFPFVFRVLRSLGVTPVRLEDAAQDVFTVVHRRLGDFERRSSVRTWLFGIAQRVASDYRRSERRKPTHLEPLPADLSCERASPHADLEAQRAADFVDAFLRSLSEEKRAFFALAFLEEMPATEVAEALGIPLNTVYSRIRSLRAELAKALKRLNTR